MKNEAFKKMMDDARNWTSPSEGPLAEEDKKRFLDVIRDFDNEPGALVTALKATYEIFGSLPAWALSRLGWLEVYADRPEARRVAALKERRRGR